MIKYISLFSGVEAAKLAFDKAGIAATPIMFSEIEKKQCQLLAAKYPDVPNLGDIRKIDFRPFKGKADFVCGGSPCQCFSSINRLTGDNSGIDLFMEFQRAVLECDPECFFYENVPLAEPHIRSCCERGFFTQGEVLSDRYNLTFQTINAADLGFVQPRKRFYMIGHKNKNMKIKINKIIDEWEIYRNMEFDYVPPTQYDIKQLLKNLDKITEKYYLHSRNAMMWDLSARKNMPTISCKHPLLEVVKYKHSGMGRKEGFYQPSNNIPSLIGKHPVMEIRGCKYRYSGNCSNEFSGLQKKIPTMIAEEPVVQIKLYNHSLQKHGEFGTLCKTIPTVVSKHPIIEIDGQSFSMRIFSPEEHEFLQGFPIGYTDGFSFSRRIQMIGNSWHVGTVAEIFRQVFA
jgi:DNA-cytosine methyltransferase